MPNLVALAENIGFNPPDATAGEEVVVSLTVLNNGAAEAKDVHVQFTDITNGRLRPIGEVQRTVFDRCRRKRNCQRDIQDRRAGW